MTAIPWSVPELLPHSGRMVLIDEAIDAGEGWVVAGVRIGEDSMFFESGRGVPVWVGIEYMAQTVALYSGICSKRVGAPIEIGLLLGTRRFEPRVDYFPLGYQLRVRACEEWQDDRMGVFDCRIDVDECLAEARLNVYRPDDIEAVISGRER